MLRQSDPDAATALLGQAQNDAVERWKRYEGLANTSTAAAATNAAAAKGGSK